MDVGILMPVKIRQAVNHRVRLLSGGGVIEPDQLPAVDPLLQDREILADQPRIERTLGNPEFAWLQIRAEFDGLDTWRQRGAPRR